MTVTTSSVFSTAFRISSYFFLRVIPSPIAQALAACFFVGYLISSFFDKPARRPTNPFYAVLFSLRTASRRIQYVNTFINTVLALAVVEFIATPFLDDAGDIVFAKVGAVYPDSVKITVRYPQSQYNGTSDSIRLVWREAKQNVESEHWNKGPQLSLQAEYDWVDTVTLKDALSMPNNTLLPYPASPLPFKTFPDHRLSSGTHLQFITSSCILPNFPYVPLQSRTIKGFELLDGYLSRTDSFAARFLLLLGDFIYADVPTGVHSTTKDAYRRLYRRVYSSPSFRKIYQRLPTFNIYDDHEIMNNFAGDGNDSVVPFANAADAFQLYNANANYAPTTKEGVPQDYHFDFRYGDVAFFVLDTRKHRSAQRSEPEMRTMLGDHQLGVLYDWLSRASSFTFTFIFYLSIFFQVNNTATFKFIVSSVPFTSLWGHDAQYDSWAGFPTEKARLLETLHTIPNVIILSGDRHEFAEIEFNGKAPSDHIIREFSTSPLSMFYIPLVRTLSMESTARGVKAVQEFNVTEDGTKVSTMVIYPVPQEKVVRYIAQGNYKWSAIDVDTRDRQRPLLKVDVVVDGQVQYQQEIVGTPVTIQSSSALGVFVAHGVKDIFNRIGIQPSRWF
ncbi:hypothetical protein D9758_001787 [Tetrapyrgos nigripes]|uniref:PhoD-like phosphatase metallophosphatase domain-containing protein n=1 Tax=Tetrapyrgos nigripes TaxID=182062 RepID=A0A8H5GXR8_9AGAR|nr:hypothetical protein D9758_001787 [Tetrapyrgos nigripes]